jgi:hypothetical protein
MTQQSTFSLLWIRWGLCCNTWQPLDQIYISFKIKIGAVSIWVRLKVDICYSGIYMEINWILYSSLINCFILVVYKYSRDSSVVIATGYGLNNRRFGVWVAVGSRIFSISSRSSLGPTQPPVQRVPGAFLPRVKRSGREAHQSPPSSAEVKKI